MTSLASVPRLSSLLLAIAAAPSVAQAAPTGAEATVEAAKKSKLFKRSLRRRDLAKAGLTKVTPTPGVEMDFQRYMSSTALVARPELKPLMSAKTRGTYLVRAPVYSETVHELSDRLVIDRRLVVELAPGTCKAKKLPKAIADLCFVRRSGRKKPSGLTKELAQIRSVLASQPGGKIAVGKVTAAQAKALSDEDLLGLILNTGTRTIRHVSVVPRKATTPGKLTDGIRSFDKPALLGKGAPNLAHDPGKPAPSKPVPGKVDAGAGADQTFDTQYFLTGWTLGDEIDDTWEYTLADASWWHGRYYVQVDYHLGFGIGVRAPFSVDVEHSHGGGNKRNVSLAVAPVDVDDKGAPAYPAVGLPQSKFFGGKELVLELEARCKLAVVIPGPDIKESCPKVDLSFSRDIDPVLGSESSTIKDWWLNGSKTGLGVDIGVASASLDVGLGADVTKGKIGVQVTPLQSSKVIGLPGTNVWLDSRDPVTFSVERTTRTSAAGFRLEDPRYGFDMRIRPKLRAKVGIDVWVYDKDWTLGPWALDFLAISQSFTLGRHDGTVKTHEFKLFKAPLLNQGQR